MLQPPAHNAKSLAVRLRGRRGAAVGAIKKSAAWFRLLPQTVFPGALLCLVMRWLIAIRCSHDGRASPRKLPKFR